MLIIHPPLAKSCEPPAALAHLAAALGGSGLSCRLCDMNIEGLLYLLNKTPLTEDTWTRRAGRHIEGNLEGLRGRELYRSRPRYQRLVRDVNRVLEVLGKSHGVMLSLANYQDGSLSPTASGDLIKAAENYRQNIYFPYFAERLTGLLAEEAPSCIGLSLNYISQALCTFAIIGFLRAHCPSVPIVLGGGLVTTWLRLPAWRNPFAGLVDRLIAGPGEAPLLAMLGAGRPLQKEVPEYRELQALPYLAPGFILPYAASSGCYWRKCSFCPETSEENPYQPLPPQQVTAELGRLTTEYRPTLLHFLDNAISPAVMRELIAHPPGVDWYGFARVGNLLTDPDFCRDLRKAGCLMLKLGIESGSQKVLDGMGKGIELRQVEKTLETLAEAGIASYVYLLFGTPEESPAEAQETMAFVSRHHRLITFLNLAIFNLPVGSRGARDLEISDLHRGDLSLYHAFHHPQGWGRREIRRFLDHEFRRRPEIQAIIQRDPPFFTSNHAPFFTAQPG
jgi:hypothetical protein